MQQYFENRTFMKIADVKAKSKYENKIFANERLDDKWKSKEYQINNSTFANIGLKGSRFKEDNLKFNVFIDCYFKRAVFNKVNFTGSVFINCNFDGVTLIECNFEYCRFQDCIVPYKAMVASLPTKENLKRELCKNLSLESLKLACAEEYRKYFFKEKEASEANFLMRFTHSKDHFYYKKYNGFIKRITGLGNYILSKLNKFLWGYGEKLSRLMMNIVIVWVIFAFAYFFGVPMLDVDTENTPLIALYMSLSNFFTVTCDYTPSTLTYQMLSTIEGGVGIVLMGFFGAALFRYINRRG